jgi:hypothetical protein
MQFRPVGIECSREELAPEGADFGEGFCNAAAALRRGGERGRSDRCHDAGLLFSLAAFAAQGVFGAPESSFGLIY